MTGIPRKREVKMIMKVNGKEIKWEDGPKGDFWTDIKIHTLWKDEKTGANLTLLKAPVSDIPPMGAHAHPDANERAIYLGGEMEAADGTRTIVSADNTLFGFVSKGETHGTGGGGKIIREMTWIRYHDGPSARVHK
jgi:hypothetical protein